MRQWKIRNDMNGHYINALSSLTFADMVERLNYLEMENVLLLAGFELNNYPEGSFWEETYNLNQVGKAIFKKVCKTFKYGSFVETDIALQCKEDFTNCIFCIDGNIYKMETEEFIECVEKLLQ